MSRSCCATFVCLLLAGAGARRRAGGYERVLWSELEDALLGTQVAVSDRTGKRLNTAMTAPAAPTRETCPDTTSLPTVDIQV